MNRHEIMGIIRSLIDQTHTAVMSTVDEHCIPHLRWITPGCTEEKTGSIFLISDSHFSKIFQIKNNPKVEMMFQTASLDKIVNVTGTVEIIDNPLIRSEVLECVGKHLHAFWNITIPERDLVALELVIEKVVMYNPQKGTKTTVDFSSEV